MVDWIITIPKTVTWSRYKQELDACVNGDMVISYRLPYKPKAVAGEMCYIVHDGYVRGYMEIVRVEHSEGFVCEITGEFWASGWYIVRSGVFHKIKPIPMKGFRGIRRYYPTPNNSSAEASDVRIPVMSNKSPGGGVSQKGE